MFTFGHLVTGLLLIVAGVLIVKYTFQLANMTGRLDWVESKLGSGSTYFVYKLLGLAVIVVGFLYATGLAVPFFTWLFGPLRSVFAPGAPH
jgi:hypothetical protein